MKIASITFGFALACGFATAVSAQEKAVGGLGQACKTELSTLCASGAKIGPFVCLKQNEAKLGAECASFVKAAEERRAKFRAACEADRAKLCSTVLGKGGQLIQCLKSKDAELSKPCAEAIAALPSQQTKQQ